MTEFNTSDFEQCDKLIKSIASREYYKYKLRVAFTKLEYDDFTQNGWVAMMDCINKGITNLDYICVSLRNAMYRGVTKTALVQTSNQEQLWFYISGHEQRMEDIIGEDTERGELFFSEDGFESALINQITFEQIVGGLNEEDRKEVDEILQNHPPKRVRYREKVKERMQRIAMGQEPYRQCTAIYQSDISGVTYDKSKNRWVFAKKINGKRKVFLRNIEQSVVEEFALNYYKEEKASAHSSKFTTKGENS